MEYHIQTPLTKEKLKDLKAGDYVYLTGTIYSARDAAHIRLHQALEEGQELPFPVQDSAIYYMGPTPSRNPAYPLGSAGPTTSSRMDKFTPELLDAGVSAVIGKGRRAQAVTDTKLEELTREVRAHNNFAQRVPVLEEQIKAVNRRLANLEDDHK